MCPLNSKLYGEYRGVWCGERESSRETFLWTLLFSPPKAHCAYHVCRRGSSTKKRWIRAFSSIKLGPRVRVHTFKMSRWPTKHIITWRTEVGTVSGVDCWGRRAQSVLRVGPHRAQLRQSKHSRGRNTICTADLPARAASDGLGGPRASSLVMEGRTVSGSWWGPLGQSETGLCPAGGAF